MSGAGLRLVGGLGLSPTGAGLLIQDEGIDLPEEPILNFVGANITATDDPGNSRINVTVTGGSLQTAYDGGETIVEDAQGAIDISRGALAPVAEPAITIIDANLAPGRTTHLLSFTDTNVEGATTADIYVSRTAASGALAIWLDRNGTAAAGAGSERDSSRIRLTASMWTGAAAAERDLELYAVTPGLAESVAGGRARLRVQYEGQSLLEIGPLDAALGAANAVIFRNLYAVNTDPPFTFQTPSAHGFNNPVVRIRVSDTTEVWRVGDGFTVSTRYDNVATGCFHTLYSSRAGGAGVANDVIGTLRFDANDSLAGQETYVSLDGVLLDPTNASEDGQFRVWIMAAGQFDIALSMIDGTAIFTRSDNAGGAVGQDLQLYHDSPTPAAADVVGHVSGYGEDSASNKQLYGQIQFVILDTTSTSEDGSIQLYTTVAGASTLALTVENARIYLEAGTLALPGLSFRVDTDSGLWWIGNGRWAPICNGVAILDLNENSGSPYCGLVAGGTVTAPALSFSADLDTGFYSPAADEIALTAGGQQVITCSEVAAVSRIGFFGTAAVVKQTSGADLTNNVTVGGTNDQIDNVVAAPVDVNAASLTSTRDAVYQLARKLKQINDGLRAYGIFT